MGDFVIGWKLAIEGRAYSSSSFLEASVITEGRVEGVEDWERFIRWEGGGGGY